MSAMSVPVQQKTSSNKRTGKRITFFNDQGVVMKEASGPRPEAPYFGRGAAPEPAQSEAPGANVPSHNAEAPHMYLSSVIFSPDKGDQSRGHYQQTLPMKWSQQEAAQQQQQQPPSQPQQQRAVAWSTMANWGQNLANYLGGVGVTDSRAQASSVKPAHEPPSLPPPTQQQPPPTRPTDKPPMGANPAAEPHREAAKPRGLDWEQQQQHYQPQAFQQTLKPGALNAQQHGASNPGGSSVLQPFQLAFGQPKQHLAGYYQTFQGNRTTLPNLNYSTQAKPPNQLQTLQQQTQEQMCQQQQHQQQQQQQQQQHILQQQQMHQQHHQMQQQQILQRQQQVQQQQHMQQQQQHMHQQQQQHIQQQMQHQQLQQQNPSVHDYYPSAPNANPHPLPQPPVVAHSQDPSPPAPPEPPEPLIQDVTPEPGQHPSEAPALQPLTQAQAAQVPSQAQAQAPPRRSRRLSKEGGAPPDDDDGDDDNPFLVSSTGGQAVSGPQGPQNGAGPEIHAAPTGVIQSTRRKRRVSQEVNLETLAQKASEMESLPPHIVKEPHRPWSPTEAERANGKRPRDDSLLPLVIPVSVPVHRPEPSSLDREVLLAPGSLWGPRRLAGVQDGMGPADHKPSVIVTRRRSLRNSPSESSGQNGGTEGEKDDDGKKSKRRPRPEPLFIPPPKPGLFIAPPVYSSITPYQSHLRSPVRLPDNPLTIPPYTPPPILSPVREGSGLYFSTFLSAAAAAVTAGGQGLPPPATPKSATRSLLRTNSCDITPPVLSAMSDVTPVSIEPRINIGSRYQAYVPELRQRSLVQLDQHQAELVWSPLTQEEAEPDFQKKVEDLMHLACSSAVCGGGTNQELALHCLHQVNGDIMAHKEQFGCLFALVSGFLANAPHCIVARKSVVLPLADPSGSDRWTAAERRQFNKGIAAYKKDFFMVQKLVSTKTVAQCVEYYYTHKKHVKIGRNGALMYGEAEPAESRANEVEVDHKGSRGPETRKEEDSRMWEGSADRKRDNNGPARVMHALPAADNARAVLILQGQEDAGSDHPLSRVVHPSQVGGPQQSSAPATKPRCDGGGSRKTSPAVATKAPAGQEGEFPCKKCGRVFYKVKSRSAHMKSHSEQEKKAAALRQREAEERAAAAAAHAAAHAAALLAAHSQHNGAAGPEGAHGDSSGGEDGVDWQ